MPQGREGGCGIHTKDFVERKVWARQEEEGDAVTTKQSDVKKINDVEKWW